MAKAPSRKSTRQVKSKSSADFFSGLELDHILNADTSPTEDSLQLDHPHTELSLSTSPSATSSRSLGQHLQLLQLDKDKLQLELQVLLLQKESYVINSATPQVDLLADIDKKKRAIDWPNDFIPGNLTSYEALDQSQFVAGFLSLIQVYEDPSNPA